MVEVYECCECHDARVYTKCVKCAARIWRRHDQMLCDDCQYAESLLAFSEFLSKLPPEVKAVGGTYDGSGDSGDFQELAGFKESAIMPDDDELNSWYNMTCDDNIQLDEETADTLRDHLFTLLDRKCSGWEIDEGSCGSFIIDVATQRIRHDHTVRVEEESTNIFDLKEDQ